MVFSSILFLVYFLPIFLLVYYVLPKAYKNAWLVIASLAFYTWGAPTFLPILILSCVIDYVSTFYFAKKKGKLWFVLVLISNVSLLLYFKYANFLSGNLNQFLNHFNLQSLPWQEVMLPIGISFLTFQKISYLVDVYRKDCEPQQSFINYLLFIVLFPHSIAGPIVRYKDIKAQLLGRFGNLNASFIFLGLFQFVIGLSMKVIIANPLGAKADLIFNALPNLDFANAWMGIICYTFQIYFDFAGYSAMAIGLGKMMGFIIPDNFNFPYTAQSITEFWKRWHITLSSWMKDYLYIPLGGNRNGNGRTYFNLFIVFMLSGFWHGASWNFLVWGAFHGLFLVVERLGLSKVLIKIGPFAMLYTLITVMIAWVFFRLEQFSDAVFFIEQLFTWPNSNIDWFKLGTRREIIVLGIACVFAFTPQILQTKLSTLYKAYPTKNWVAYFLMFLCVLLYVLCLGEIFATGFNPFIYFKF